MGIFCTSLGYIENNLYSPGHGNGIVIMKRRVNNKKLPSISVMMVPGAFAYSASTKKYVSPSQQLNGCLHYRSAIIIYCRKPHFINLKWLVLLLVSLKISLYTYMMPQEWVMVMLNHMISTQYDVCVLLVDQIGFKLSKRVNSTSTHTSM